MSLHLLLDNNFVILKVEASKTDSSTTTKNSGSSSKTSSSASSSFLKRFEARSHNLQRHGLNNIGGGSSKFKDNNNKNLFLPLIHSDVGVHRTQGLPP